MTARREEILDAAYAYVLEHGAGDVSLRPLAAAIGSSPRVLLFLFGSKEGMLREILARARADELRLLDEAGGGDSLVEAASQVWRWLAAAEHRSLLVLWAEAYGRSLVDPGGPWSGFAEATVGDWLDLLARTQSRRRRRTRAGEAERTLVLAVLRGALLDLLATGDHARTTAAVEQALQMLGRTDSA